MGVFRAGARACLAVAEQQKPTAALTRPRRLCRNIRPMAGYEDYYAVFFLDPDGLKLEGMKYGELTARAKRPG